MWEHLAEGRRLRLDGERQRGTSRRGYVGRHPMHNMTAPPSPTSTPTTTGDIYSRLDQLDQNAAAVSACVQKRQPVLFANALPQRRAAALAKVCADTRADKVRVTWADYDENRITEVFDCRQKSSK